MPGVFHTLRIQQSKEIENQNGLKVFGVRFAKFLPEGWVHLNAITPSPSLLRDAKKMEKEGTWNEEAFRNMYKPRFIKEIQNNIMAKKELAQYARFLKEGKDVYYACYCKDPRKCHRGIVALIMKKNGYEVEIR